MATENTRKEEGEEIDGLNYIDMAMKSVSNAYFEAKASDDKTFNGISCESWLSCVNYLGKLKMKKDNER